MSKKSNKKVAVVVGVVIVIAAIAALAAALVPAFADVSDGAGDLTDTQNTEGQTVPAQTDAETTANTGEAELPAETEESKPADDTSADAPEESKPADDTSADAPEESKPADDTSADAPEESGPADDTSADVPEESGPADDTSADAPEESGPADNASTDKTEEIPVADQKIVITVSELAISQGAVNGNSGEIKGYANNWYAEILIPEGAEQVRFLNYQTGGTWGSAFMNENAYISGYSSKNAGGEWVTLDIPKDATVFLYGYLQDSVAADKGYPAFEYLEFIGENIKRVEQPEEPAAADQKAIWTAADLAISQGAVNGNSGEIKGYANNWYAEILIPEGAEQVRFLNYQTGGTWGSAFMNENAYISGYSSKNAGGEWVTLDIPKDATVFLYGYLQDSVAADKGYPTFEYVEFIGENLKRVEPTAKPSMVKHTFSVEVNIAPALGKEGEVKGTDYGYIILPENYTEDGEATRLIIVCHGAGVNLTDYRSSIINKSFSQHYWVGMGYAIMDMYACPPELADGSELHYGNPTVLECYEKGYKYVMEKYNLKTDGIFVVGSSMGGLSSFQIVQSGKFPVLAQVANCPAIDLFKQAYCNPWKGGTYQRERIAAYFGFEGTAPKFTTTKHVPSKAEIEYFKNNFDKITAYSPIFANVTEGDMTAIFGKLPSSATVADAEEAALYAQLSATHPCPLLIIHNKNDSTVSYRYSEYLYGMIKRGNPDLDVELKLYATGGHAAWDNGPKAAVKNYAGNSVTLSESKRLAIDFFAKYEP